MSLTPIDGIATLALRSPTLPPATTTNCLLVGQERFIIIDPGAHEPSEQARLQATLEARLRAGHEPVAVVLTHHHPDHIAGLDALLGWRALEIWAHRETAARIDAPVARELVDDERLDELGAHTLRVLETPGHAPGHLAFWHQASGAAIVGDLVASEGTILINPPEGHMGLYLESLARVRDADACRLYPAHGEPIDDARGKLEGYIAHRRGREAKVLRALRDLGDAAEAEAILERAYDDAPRAVWPLARLSLEAHLIFLEEQERVRREDRRWLLITAAP